MAESNGILNGATATTSTDPYGYPGSNTIDGNAATHWHSGPEGPPFWIAFDLGVGVSKAAESYEYTCRANGEHYWRTWELQGSNDNFSTWDVLDFQENLTFTAGEKKTFTCVGAGMKYRYYRFNIILTSSSYCVAAELAIFEPPPVIAKNFLHSCLDRMNMKGVSTQNWLE
jgi:hypothetical protein